MFVGPKCTGSGILAISRVGMLDFAGLSDSPRAVVWIPWSAGTVMVVLETMTAEDNCLGVWSGRAAGYCIVIFDSVDGAGAFELLAATDVEVAATLLFDAHDTGQCFDHKPSHGVRIVGVGPVGADEEGEGPSMPDPY